VILNDELLREAKKRAADEGSTLKSVLEQALRAYLGKPGLQEPFRLRWRTEKGRPRPGVRLDNNAALIDYMEGRG